MQKRGTCPLPAVSPSSSFINKIFRVDAAGLRHRLLIPAQVAFQCFTHIVRAAVQQRFQDRCMGGAHRLVLLGLQAELADALHGVYNRKGFGVLPRAVVWGLLGMGINAAMIIFSKGVPQFMEYMGMANAAAIINGEFCLDKLWIALAISVAMNTIFAPVFMTFHKITDTHILDCGGSPRSLLTPIPMTRIITHLNWDAQWNFVFKKTIPFFWYPAHTITFLLPGEMRVLFAAILGVVLGVLLAIAARMK